MKTELERKLELFKSLRFVVEEDARKKTAEAGDAIRRAAQIEDICAKIEKEIQEGNCESRPN